jgi:glyoxalase family protein
MQYPGYARHPTPGHLRFSLSLLLLHQNNIMNTTPTTSGSVFALSAAAPPLALPGLHHVTAMASDPTRNAAFYTGVLGLRLVKQTVNFDDPTTYHLYYGDSAGTPGTILTFFPWAGLRRGSPGNGQVYATAFSIPATSLPFWTTHLAAHHIATTRDTDRFGDAVLHFTDPDGLLLELVATTAPDTRTGHTHPKIPAEHALRGFHGVTVAVIDAPRTAALLTGPMGYRVVATAVGRTRYAPTPGGPGTFVDLLVDPSIPRGLNGAGTVHHLAFRTPTDATQAEARTTLLTLGYHVSPVMDRNYFHSIYYREPGGVLFEIATDPPGFTVDESPATLGTSLMLPMHYETQRAAITAALPKLS